MPVYRVKIIDSNPLAGTEHRIAPTRTTRAAVLPGQAVVVLDWATMLIIDVVPCADADTQERALVDHVLPGVEAGDLGIEDRNFRTTRLVFGVRAWGGSFLVRQHQSTLSWAATTPWVAVGRISTGMVHEQTRCVRDPARDEVMQRRRIRLDLDQPTEDNETVILLLTDVPKERADALLMSETSRRRWRRRRATHTTPQARGGAEPTAAVTISVSALLELAEWCRQRLTESHGGITCPTPNDTPLPPAHDHAGAEPEPGSGDPLDPHPCRQEATTPRPARTTPRPTPRGTAPRGGRS